MYSQYLRLGVNIADSDYTVMRAAMKLVAKKHRLSREMRDARRRFMNQMLAYHKQSRDLYRDVMRGELDGE